jgi:hypothetical protein
MGKVAAIGRDGRFMVNPSNHSESTTHYSKSYISEGTAVKDDLLLYWEADDWGSYPGTKTLTGKFTEYSSGSSHYRTMGRNGVVLLGTSTSWIGYFSADPSSTGRHTIVFDYWSDVAQSNSLVLDNDGIHDNEYNATLSTQTYRQTRFENFTHTTTGNIKFYFRNNAAGNKVYVDNVRFFKSDDTWNDLSGNGNNGTIDAPTISLNSTAGLCFDFDGSDDLVTTSFGSGRNPFSSPTTYVAWVKTDSATASRMWLDHGSNGTNQRLYCALITADNTTPFGIQSSAWSVPSNADTSKWYHQALVMDSGTARGYYDGIAAGTKSYTSYTLPGNVRAGGRASYNWDGQIASFAIYDKALSAAEVKQNFNSERNRFGV